MNGSNKGIQGFGVTCGNTSPTLQSKERIFNKVAHFVQIAVIFTLLGPIAFGRDHRLHMSVQSIGNDLIRVVATICQQRLRVNPLDQVDSFFTIRSGTLCNNNSDWHTMRIHGQVYFGIEPPFVFAMA